MADGQTAPGRSIPVRMASVVLAVGLLSLLGSCVSSDSLPEHGPEFHRAAAAEMFSVGYEAIADTYIEAVPTEAIALAALDGVSGLDPKVQFLKRGSSLIVTRESVPVAEFAAPKSDDVTRWALLTAAAIDAGRHISPTLKATGSEDLYQATFDSSFRKLDQYSRYNGAETTVRTKASRYGYSGIGVTIGGRDGSVRITSVFEGSPAASAGLLAGDRIDGIDGWSADGATINDVADRLRGIDGSVVEVRVERSGRLVTRDVTRGSVIEPTVHYSRLGDAAYVRLSGFNANTSRSLRQAIGQARREIGPRMQGVILDLRDNRGGLLDEAVRVSDLFIDSGTILDTFGRHADAEQHFQASRSKTAFRDHPVIVLIDGGSASAAEIVAAALQDSGRALVLGTRSFGKGTIQRTIDMPNSGELVLTWTRMYAPSGYRLSRFGVFPTICTADPDSADADALVESIRSGGIHLGDALHRRRSADSLDPKNQESLLNWCVGRHPPQSDDRDSQIALRLLRDQGLFQQAFSASRIALGERPATMQ